MVHLSALSALSAFFAFFALLARAILHLPALKSGR
jgi:hypothetical protein